MDVLQSVSRQFEARFGAPPETVCFAPGRVNLIGEHTDYNGGHVFPCALSLGTWCAARRRTDSTVRLATGNIPRSGVLRHPLGYRARRGSRCWSRYPESVINAFRHAGFQIPTGMDLYYYGNIPSGSGLSSSASMEVVTGAVLRELYGLRVSSVRLAQLGQYAENVYVGVQCGIMDQFASAMGRRAHAIYLDTASLRYEYAPLRLPDSSIVVCNSRVKHSLASSEYNLRRSQCETALAALRTVRDIPALCALTPEEFEALSERIPDPLCRKRARHAVRENARTQQALEALRADRLADFGRLMNESHVSLRDDYEVSCPELDLLTRLAWDTEGVVGSRMTGGGFGGCTVSIVKTEALADFQEKLARVYRERTGLEAEFYTVEAGDGVRRLI